MKSSRIISIFSRLVDILWWLSLAGLALLTVTGIMLAVVRPWAGEENMTLSWTSPGLSIDFSVPGGMVNTNDSLVVLSFFGMACLLVGLTAVILFQLRVIMLSIRTGIRFSPETVRRLRLIGWTLLAGSVVTGIIRTYIAAYIASRIMLEGVTLNVRPGMDWMLLFMGFVLFVLAEVWRQASELQEENDLTV